MKTTRPTAALAMIFAAATLAGTCAAAEGPAPPRDGVLVHITHGKEDAHRLLMGLSMANMMAADHDVTVYFDIKAVEVVLKDAADVTYAQFKPSGAQLADLKLKGVTLMACPGCLKAAGKAAADLAPGVTVADTRRFFSFTKGRILTLDY